jgi:tetratricopeptide (TPR) repeat protein
MTPPRLHGQCPPSPAAPAPDADLAKRVEALDVSITQSLDTGRIAEAVRPAREKLDLLERGLGKDHWRTGDACRDLETYRRLAGRPGEVRDRYLKARGADAREGQLYGRGQYAEAAPLLQEALTICRDILGEGHPLTATCYNNLAWSLDRQGKHDDALRASAAADASYEQARLRGATPTSTPHSGRASSSSATRTERRTRDEPFGCAPPGLDIEPHWTLDGDLP